MTGFQVSTQLGGFFITSILCSVSNYVYTQEYAYICMHECIFYGRTSSLKDNSCNNTRSHSQSANRLESLDHLLSRETESGGDSCQTELDAVRVLVVPPVVGG